MTYNKENSGFKQQLISSEQMEKIGQDFILHWERFQRLHEEKLITDVELATCYILLWSILRKPKNWLGAKLTPENDYTLGTDQFSTQDFSHILSQSNFQNEKALSKLNHHESIIHFCSNHLLNSVPISVNRSLKYWSQKKYPLKLFFHIPTPYEVLLMQAAGYRCVTLLNKKSEIMTIEENHRDAFGFILHDLIHADHFFSNLESSQSQIYFSQLAVQLYKLPEILDLMNRDQKFKTQFEYLTSDMNTHFIHLLKTLKAILAESLKDSETTQEVWENVLKLWNWPHEWKHLAATLNTENESSESHRILYNSVLNHIACFSTP